MKMRMRSTAILMTICVSSTACLRTVPPPPDPSQELPKNVGNIPPEVEGKGRVIIDVTNGPAQVEEVLAQTAGAASNGSQMVYAYGEVTRNVCVKTPCAVNLELGQHNLRFVSRWDEGHVSEGTVDVGQSDSVFRHTMGGYTSGGAPRVLGLTSIGVGTTGALVGGLLLLLGAVDSSTSVSVDPNTGASTDTTTNSGSGITTAGAVTLGISAGLLALGIGLMVASPATLQEGSSTQFPLDSSKTNDEKKHPTDAMHSL